MKEKQEATTFANAGHVYLKIENNIGWLRINNQLHYNAMTFTMWQQMAQLIQEAENNTEVRIIAITGDGTRAFVSGADISEFNTLRDTPQQVKAYEDAVAKAQNAISNSNKPTVAVINGICMGGGIGIALACDIRICNETSRFRMPAARLGLGYDVSGLKRAVDVMGYTNAADIFLSARTFYGRDALQLGMVNHCFENEYFELQANNVLKNMATNAPLSMKATKIALRFILNNNQTQAKITEHELSNVEEAIQACFESIDYREGQLAFKEKRDPTFSGK